MPENMPAPPDFPVLRKGGFDPASVESHLADLYRFFDNKVAAAEAHYSDLEAELEEARKREEAVHLTLVAATKTKEELLVNAQRQADEMLTSSRTEADELLAAAKKEAFRVVAESREAAESSATEAREEAARITAEAAEAADSTRDAARREAIEMINTVESDTAALLAAQEGALADMRRKYEEEEAESAARVEVLRATAADLEARLKAIATGTLTQAGTFVVEAAAAPAITAAEPPPPAPKARPPVTPVADQAAAPATNPAAPPSESDPVGGPEEAVAAAAMEAAAQEAPTPVEAGRPADAARPGHEFTDGLIDTDDEVAGPDQASGQNADSVEDLAEVEAVQSNVEPDEVAAEVEQVASSSSLETTASEPLYPDPFSEDAGESDRLRPAAGAAEETDELTSEPEPIPAAVGAPLNGTADAGEDGNRKGSYYSRRSAKLPRIGTEAGRSALAAANAIRGATRGTPPEETDVTAQTA